MSLFEGDLVIFHDDPFLLEDSSVSQIASPPRGLSHLPVEFRAPNCPHKLTKTAEPWLGGGAALSGSELHAAVTSAAVRSRYCMLVAAAAAPSVGDRHGRRSLQLRVSSLGGYAWTCQINSAPVAVLAPSARPPLTPSARTMSVRAPFRSMLHKG